MTASWKRQQTTIKMQTIDQTIDHLKSLPQAERVTLLTTTVKAHSSTQKTAAKVMRSMIEAGDCTGDNIAEFAKRHCRIEIRNEVQGVYQALKVLSAIRDNEIPNATEADFDRIGWTAMQELSRFMNPKSLLHDHKEKAFELFLGAEPVAKLKALAKEINKKPESTAITAGDGAGAGESPIAAGTSVETTRPANIHDFLAGITSIVDAENDPIELEKIQQMLYSIMMQAQEKINTSTAATVVDVEEVKAA